MRAAIYCRLSEEDRNKRGPEEDSESIQNQKTLLCQYAQEREWEIFGIYSDDDYTGADRNRPAFRRLLADAEARRFDIVLCKTQSRFTRELELVERYLHDLFPRWGIRFIGVVDGADTAVRGNKKARQINGLVNEWYLEDLSDNIKSVLTAKRREGLHIGSFALYGYRKDPDRKGRLLIDEEAAEVVREVFRLYAAGMGKSAIARLLNQRRIPNPTEYKRRKGLRYRQPDSHHSALWRYRAITGMLRNEAYIGNLVQGRYGSVSYKTKENRSRPEERWIRVERTHAPIVERELWDRVQVLLAGASRPCASGETGLLAGKVVCAHCGYAMNITVSRGKRYFRCRTQYAAKDACRGAFLSEEALITALEREASLLLEQYAEWDRILAEAKCAPGQDERLRERLRTAPLRRELVEALVGEIRVSHRDPATGQVEVAFHWRF